MGRVIAGISGFIATLLLSSALQGPAHSSPLGARQISVVDRAALTRALRQAKPGDRIVMASGIWRDVDIDLSRNGVPQARIFLAARTPGKTFVEGVSSLRIGGAYITVSGLVFRNGHSPRSEVIAFRSAPDRVATHARVTDTMIEDFSQPERKQVDLWVGLYGQDNRVDHNAFIGKTNAGPTVAVGLDSPASRENHHTIDHNYFGHRPVYGGNGGESLRIGISAYSMYDSDTLIANNVFDHCDGEVEIISNKSGGNIIRGNTFYQSRGALSLRHGDNAVVEGNAFLGDGVPFTGGIRVINEGHTIRNNVFEGLTGRGFVSGFAVMNGVPNSPVNRYRPVKHVLIANNSFIDVAEISLGEGADAERSMPPEDVTFQKNSFEDAEAKNPFVLRASENGFHFLDNDSDFASAPELSVHFQQPSASTGKRVSKGIILFPRTSKANEVGAHGEIGTAFDQTGPSWYARSAASRGEQGRTLLVKPGIDTLSNALAHARAGDVYVLDEGKYDESRVIRLSSPVTIRGRAPDKVADVVIAFRQSFLFEIVGGGALTLADLSVTGELAPDSTGNALVEALGSGRGNDGLDFDHVRLQEFTVNHRFDIVRAERGAFFDHISIENSEISDVSGAVLRLDTERDDLGYYNADSIEISDTKFRNIQDPIAVIYRGGHDESTFGPNLKISGSEIHACGQSPFVEFFGGRTLEIKNSALDGCNPASFTPTTGQTVLMDSGNIVNGSLGQPAVILEKAQ